MPAFQLEGISFKTDEPKPDIEWTAVADLRGEAYAASLPHRSTEEIDYLTQRDNSLAFFAGCMDPHYSIKGGRLFPRQDFGNLTIAKAYDANREVIGFGYAADNVSGRFSAERWAKMRGVTKKYAWLREIVVHPDMQHRGIGTAIGALMLDHFDERQPVSAYTWGENQAGTNFVRSLGLSETRDENGLVARTSVYVFGPKGDSAAQIRWSNNTVQGVHEHITASPADEEALSAARQATVRHK